MTQRTLLETLTAQPASDGAGVKLLRVFGGRQLQRFDPFLMLDEFGSESADDYIGGFPPHPHRGFETITYMLQGKMEHQDHLGNVGLLQDGDVQWMTAAHGIIHSEMPKQTEGKMHGFQFWLNLPAAQKLAPPAWQDLPAQQVPRWQEAGVAVVAVAGSAQINGQRLSGAFERPSTEPLLWDIQLAPGAQAQIILPEGHNAMVYVFVGQISLGDQWLQAQQLGRLSASGALQLHNSTGSTSRLLVIAGKPLGEPIVQYGPFVMNTQAEIDQALADYRNGTLTQV
jgi:quercetin 2,3-dioxygenase